MYLCWFYLYFLKSACLWMTSRGQIKIDCPLCDTPCCAVWINGWTTKHHTRTLWRGSTWKWHSCQCLLHHWLLLVMEKLFSSLFNQMQHGWMIMSIMFLLMRMDFANISWWSSKWLNWLNCKLLCFSSFMPHIVPMWCRQAFNFFWGKNWEIVFFRRWLTFKFVHLLLNGSNPRWLTGWPLMI